MLKGSIEVLWAEGAEKFEVSEKRFSFEAWEADHYLVSAV
jgi:hypothetical protein